MNDRLFCFSFVQKKNINKTAVNITNMILLRKYPKHKLKQGPEPTQNAIAGDNF
jgi:hypothetical protein